MPEEKKRTKYEIMLLLVPGLGEKKTNEVLQEVRDLLIEQGGEIYHEDIWGEQDLAYVIKKNEQGFYAVFNFEMDGTNIPELNQPLILHAEVLRYLITKTAHNFELVSHSSYVETAEQERVDREKEREEKMQKRGLRPQKKESPKTEKKEVKAPVKKKEEKVEAKVEKKAPAKAKAKAADVDEKLKSIINDPDISL